MSFDQFEAIYKQTLELARVANISEKDRNDAVNLLQRIAALVESKEMDATSAQDLFQKILFKISVLEFENSAAGTPAAVLA